VVDGNATQTPWISGSDPPQWVEVDLQDQYDLESIQIVVETGSDDPFFYTHEIQVKRNSSASYQTIHTFADQRVNFEVLTYRPSDGSLIEGVRFVRILIPQAPGWAALHELSVLLPQERSRFDVPAPPILTNPRPSLPPWDGSALKWKNDESNLEATIQIASDSLFVNLIEEQSGITEDQFDVTHLLSNSPLWWRVKQVNSLGESVWSVTGKLDQMLTMAWVGNKSFRIYPNPTKDYLVIDHQGQADPLRDMAIMTVSGQVIRQFEPWTTRGRAYLGGIPPGLYNLRIRSQSGLANLRFVKTE
jgi:hypothetical protein